MRHQVSCPSGLKIPCCAAFKLFWDNPHKNVMGILDTCSRHSIGSKGTEGAEEGAGVLSVL